VEKYAMGTTVFLVGSVGLLALFDNQWIWSRSNSVPGGWFQLLIVIAGVLLQGAPRQHRPHLCSLGILLCLLLYSAEKTLIYLCLTEKVRLMSLMTSVIGWDNAAIGSCRMERLTSKAALAHLSLLCLLAATRKPVYMHQRYLYWRNSR
jgi:hypothetical protein